MAGIRLGYGITSDYGLINKMYKSGAPWNVSTIAQAKRNSKDLMRKIILTVQDFL